MSATRQPLYALFTDLLRRALQEGTLPQGAILLEGPLAELLNATRMPVRQALQQLEGEGLLSRFEGRGFVVGPLGSPAQRVVLTTAMLGLESAGAELRKTRGWESIYSAVERDVILLSVFGRYRLNELEMARHYGVGRTVAHDVMLRLESLGLLERDERQRWSSIPLDNSRIQQLYELRGLLEPVALRGALGRISKEELTAKIDAIEAAQAGFQELSRVRMDEIEQDLHVDLYKHCGNKDLLQCLKRTNCILILSKYEFDRRAKLPKYDSFLAEHRQVLQALSDGDAPQAEALLRQHLTQSCQQVILRAEKIRSSHRLPALGYIDG